MNHSKHGPEASTLTHLYRWIWGKLEEGNTLPVGGSIFASELTTKLHLDFSSFPLPANQKILVPITTSIQDSFEAWYNQMPEMLRKHVDSQLYFSLIMAQNGMEQRLGVQAYETRDIATLRSRKYQHETPKLSDFRDGSAHCAERAALGHWMLTIMGIPNVYMSGVSFFEDVSDGADHSWIVLFPGTKQSMIFDIARPENGKLPNLYKPDEVISVEVFSGQDNAFIETKKLLGTTTRYFWVSDNPHMITEIGNVVKSSVSKHTMSL